MSQYDLHNAFARESHSLTFQEPPSARSSTSAHHLLSPASPTDPRGESDKTLAYEPPVVPRSSTFSGDKEQQGLLVPSTPASDGVKAPQSLKPSFYHAHFCRLVTSDRGQVLDPPVYRFSPKAKGSLICGAIMLVAVLAVIIGPVVAATIRPVDYSTSADRDSPFVGIKAGPSTGKPQGGVIASSGAEVDLAINNNFADPFVIQSGDTWYAFATNSAITLPDGVDQTAANTTRANVQVATSKDFVSWQMQPVSAQPLPNVGGWAIPGYRAESPNIPKAFVWAPAILQRPSDGKWIMYYSAQSRERSWTHCFGAAISNTDSLLGPYTPIQRAFPCHPSLGGDIDPAPFVDGDSIYVAYKIDGNNRGNGGSCGNTKAPIKSTPIMLQKTKDDGVTPDGNAVQIFDRTAADGPLVEAPSIVKSDEGIYFLFYSSGCTGDPTYTVKYATANNLAGPYTRAKEVLLKTGDAGLLAPGSATVSQGADGQWRMAFHARVRVAGGSFRGMFTTGVQFNGTVATLESL